MSTPLDMHAFVMGWLAALTRQGVRIIGLQNHMVERSMSNAWPRICFVAHQLDLVPDFGIHAHALDGDSTPLRAEIMRLVEDGLLDVVWPVPEELRFAGPQPHPSGLPGSVHFYENAARWFRDAYDALDAQRRGVATPYPDFVRAEGAMTCDVCGLPFRKHPEDGRYVDNTGHCWLVVLCDERLVKL